MKGKAVRMGVACLIFGSCFVQALPAEAGACGAIVSLPKRAIVSVVGTAVGTPIAIVRCTHREIKNKTKEAYELGGVPKPIGYLTAGIMGIPSGILSGAIVGTVDGVLDGVANSEKLDKASTSQEKLAF